VLRGGRPLTNGIKLALIVLHDHMDEEGRARVKYAVLAKALGVSESSLSKRFADACAAGYLVVTAKAGYGYPVAYQALIPLPSWLPTTTDLGGDVGSRGLWSPTTTDHRPPRSPTTGDHRDARPWSPTTGDLPKVTADSNHVGTSAAGATSEISSSNRSDIRVRSRSSENEQAATNIELQEIA
jgi:hypothetical protein